MVLAHRAQPLASQAGFVYYLFVAKSIEKVIPKRPGRPATGKDPVRTFRLSDEFMAHLDQWAEHQADKPSRSEAIRRLVELGFKAKAK